MKIKALYLILLLITLQVKSQVLDFNLARANSCRFNGKVFVFGLSTDAKPVFKLYRLEPDLKKADSTSVDIGKVSPESLLQMNADTLHNFLNIYIQKKEKKEVRVLRYNRKFELIATIEDVDVARLNSISNFENEVFYSENDVYTIRVRNDDSAGKQFYLNKFGLKSELKNFEYEPKWQFPFERRNINSAHIVYASKLYVLMYVNVLDGKRRGQWILKVNAQSGTLIRGSKLNDKGEFNFYAFGKLLHDTASRSIYVIGQKLALADFDQKENKLNLNNKPAITIYLAQIDSTFETLTKDEFKIPVTEPKGNKTVNAYLLRIEQLTRSKEGNFSFEGDVFKGTNSSCYQYCNTITYSLTQTEEKLMLEKNTVNSNPDIERFYFTADKMDMNGKVCVDSLKDFEKVFYKTITFPVKQACKLSETGNRIWAVRKADTKKGQDNFSLITPVKNIYQCLKQDDIPKAENPGFMQLSLTQLILTRQLSEGKYQLKILAW